MGQGVVIEKGTHRELLGNDNSAYSRLVQAQRLRERTEGKDTDSDNNAENGQAQDVEKAVLNEVPLGRKNTGRSLGSEILEKRQQQEGDEVVKEHSLTYLFMRMGIINRECWKRYLFGAIFASCEYQSVGSITRANSIVLAVTGMVYPAFGIVYGNVSSG
jgi:ATP-binding cassette subfamily B (MDR/TAP) protein 1